MSRIGKLPLKIPAGVDLELADGQLKCKGPKGDLVLRLDPRVTVKIEKDILTVERRDDSREARSLHGLTRKLIGNMVHGVSRGFSRTLTIHGVGYRAEAKGRELRLQLGYSHPVVFQLPPAVTAKVDKQTVITLESVDRQILGETAAAIRALRPPEPYKGKGIKYEEEVIRRKAGKAVGAATT